MLLDFACDDCGVMTPQPARGENCRSKEVVPARGMYGKILKRLQYFAFSHWQ